ncbi:hypothetical protein [uncultured Gilvimarinus sp.]|uniref:hypothetical protein n=1 Tax=uncultured Gilvimarinus sp. TaxID=1689143 RepID=UPI0030DBAEC2
MSISFKSYISWALFSPFILAATFWIWPTDSIFMVLPFAIAIAGIPYCIFCAAFILWSRKRHEGTVKKATWLLPVIFAPIAGIGALIVSGDSIFSKGSLATMAALGVYTITIGYFYVISCWLVYFLLNKVLTVFKYGA